MTTLETFKKNIHLRLRWLGVKPGKVSRSAGKASNWLFTILSDKYSKKVSSVIIDDVAAALGVEPWELIDPDFNPSARPDPEWCQVSK